MDIQVNLINMIIRIDHPIQRLVFLSFGFNLTNLKEFGFDYYRVMTSNSKMTHLHKIVIFFSFWMLLNPLFYFSVLYL